MFFDPVYWVIIGLGMALSLWAQFRVKGAFRKYSRLPTRSGLTGAQVAEQILRQNNIDGVKIEPIRGSMTDHYDPRTRTLRLSEPVYGSRSMAAFGVAAHEVGHAIQHAENYKPLTFRSAWVPVANFGSGLSFVVLILAMFLGGAATAYGYIAAVAGVILFATATVFTLITLPVEFDASRRALQSLESGGLVSSEELGGARKVLNAAAMTYVAAFVNSLMMLLYWAYRLGLLGGRRS
jgi:Zn-dependent membrane protease YugP